MEGEKEEGKRTEDAACVTKKKYQANREKRGEKVEYSVTEGSEGGVTRKKRLDYQQT